MTPEQFTALAEAGYTHVPFVREIPADLDTPLSTYLKLAAGPFSYLFESVQGGEKWGRYSIIGLPSRRVLRVSGGVITVTEDGCELERVECVADPLSWIESFRQRYRVAPLPGPVRFAGGLVGYFGYDTVRYIEPRLAQAERAPADTPDILLMFSNRVLVFDNLSGTLSIVICADVAEPEAYEHAQRELDDLQARLEGPLPPRAVRKTDGAAVAETDFVSEFGRAGYESAVQRIKDYIVDGDVMQVVLSQRMSIAYQADPLDLYRGLRRLNPSPYMYYLDLDDFHIVGSSPEILVRLEDGMVTVRPIAGTRPRGADEASDRQLEDELLADPKERAEHLMLIDLGRNDVGRVAQTGSVRLTERMVIERYSHVMHIVSNVTGRLREGLGPLDVLRATFPAGTVSGAPKVRAMEIIDELEPSRRGVYAGAVGYIGWNGNMDTAIAIRTAVIRDGRLCIQAGAGIVADSVPASEWEETMNKGRAVFRAVAMVSGK
ncbi:MAG: anthranilate synthase component I [Gammaproteobacteria bacterium]|jgi:anthranilate synthase component 1|nr:anthranilate synthase component I [Gammaproteobacteria bacterium]